jgi:hypothetical protein
MEDLMSPRLIKYVIALIAVCAVFAVAGKDFWIEKPYTEWSEKEVKKLLQNSPWSKTLTLSQAMPSRGGGRGGGGGGGAPPGGMGGARIERAPQKATVAWHSRPVREAYARQILLQNPEAPQEQIDRILNYPDTPYYSLLVTGIMPGRSRGRDRESGMQEFKEQTYLEKKNKEKIVLQEVVMPSGRGQPMILRFPKQVDGTPTLTLEDKSVKLVIRTSNNTIRFSYKLSDMVIGGKLEL